MIGAFRSSYCSIVPASSCSLSRPLLYRSPVVVFLDRGYPCFRNFDSTIPVDVLRVKSYVNSFLDPTCVPVRISINDTVQSVDLIAWRRLAVSSRNVAIYISSDYMVRQTIIHFIIASTTMNNNNLFLDIRTCFERTPRILIQGVRSKQLLICCAIQ